MASESPTLRRPRKRFGQHFLHDAAMIRRIVEAIDAQTDEVLCEIGPGQGALTDRLVETGTTLHLVEIDRDLVPVLRQRYAQHPQVQVHERDVLSVNLGELSSDQPLVMVGNLPYNISSVLLIHLLAQREHISRMLFMLQKEVAQRLVASPGASQYGRLSVMVGRVYHSRLLFDVGPGAFTPPPKVQSSVVALQPYPEPLGPPVSDAAFETLVRQAFSQRRKTLRNTLKETCSEALIKQAGIDPTARPQTVAPEAYARLVTRLTG